MIEERGKPVDALNPAARSGIFRPAGLGNGLPAGVDHVSRRAPIAMSKARLSAVVRASSAALTTLPADPATTTAPLPNTSIVEFLPRAADIAPPIAGVVTAPCSPPGARRISKTGTEVLSGRSGFVGRETELTEKATSAGALENTIAITSGLAL